MPKAIVIGASSGIGRELAKLISRDYQVGLAARRIELLEELSREIAGQTYIKKIDLAEPEEAMCCLGELIDTMNGVDLVIISSGTGFLNEELAWGREKETIDVNVMGFVAMVNISLQRFLEQGYGVLVGISSIAGIRGNPIAPAYNASKAFVSNYLEGIRWKIKKLHLKIKIVDIRPGFVDTAMAKGDRLFWVASPQKAAAQIYRCIQKGKARAYITRRWILFAWLLKLMPDWLLYKF
jgi:short-subunit dehydrogenase